MRTALQNPVQIAGRPSAATLDASTLPVALNADRMAVHDLPAPAGGRLLEKATSFVEEHRIRAYEVGPDQKTTIVTIANLLQEVAGNNGVALWGRTDEGFATDPIMVAHKLIFAATRIQIQMHSYPKWGDLVEIETWFQAEGRIAANRSWTIKDVKTGRVLGNATSTWVMVNTETRKLSKIPEAMREKLEVFAPKPPRHPIPMHQTRLKLPDLPLPAEIESPVQVARRSDMDMNGHINNVTYIAWALETVPSEVFNNGHLAEVEIDFKAECHAGDTVESLGCRLPPQAAGNDTHKNGSAGLKLLHVLQRCDDSDEKRCVELVRARTSWRMH